ncbi:hypothetical protein [Alishewanella sp. HH-ZS]|uniref:hypothetical protein n=1 Tax=Alishewanella sp. HH-ZS TaxID=1856684 RepID=UPI000823757F|nr:hypothetical protein [Alishewanella sp. HH-ZS]OCW96685.1 hypothetical protein A9165_10125 [Alishewanella sp. HH-ZS]
MSNLALNLTIKGDFIDSFIYSGILYLLDTDFNFKSYRWEDICNYIKNRNGFKSGYDKRIFNYFIDNNIRDFLPNVIDTEINETELLNLKRDEIHIKYWPSDISLFANRLYYSGDDGVYYINTNHRDALFKKERKKNKIFGVKSFSISPETYQRVALGAGNEGVFTSCFYSTPNNPTEKKISNSSCIDVEWINNFLFINADRFFINKFKNILNKSEINSEEKYKKIRHDIIEKFGSGMDSDNTISLNTYKKYVIEAFGEPPEKLDLASRFRYGWSSGDVDYFLTNDNSIAAHNKITGTVKYSRMSNRVDDVLKVRTSGCGTVVETLKGCLFLLTEDGCEKISDEHVSWRVYPRARHHSNHLHIVNEDNINIRVYGVNESESFLRSYLSKKNSDDYLYSTQEMINKKQ